MFDFSNAGSNAIIKHSLDHFREGKRREEIQLVDMENILAKAVINTDTKGKCSGQRKKKTKKITLYYVVRLVTSCLLEMGRGLIVRKQFETNLLVPVKGGYFAVIM